MFLATPLQPMIFNSTLIRVDYQRISYESLIISEQLLHKAASNSFRNTIWLLSKISETYQHDNSRLLLYTTHCSVFGQ